MKRACKVFFRNSDEISDKRCFDIAKALFALTLEVLTDRAANLLLDHLVGVKEG